MRDIAYNIETQDWEFKNGDFVVTEDPSEQNGGVVLLARAFVSINPILGIGINQLRGGSVAQANYEMNRWVQQIVNDQGAAQYSIVDRPEGPEFNWEVNYE